MDGADLVTDEGYKLPASPGDAVGEKHAKNGSYTTVKGTLSLGT